MFKVLIWLSTKRGKKMNIELCCIHCGLSELAHIDKRGVKAIPEACDNFEVRQELEAFEDPALKRMIENG